MKILQIYNQYRFSGGEDVMNQSIVRLLRRQGHEVYVFKRCSKDIRGPWIKMRALMEGIYSRSSKKAVSRLLTTEQPDVVHVHNLYPLISPSVLLACRDANVPVLKTCSNLRLTCPVAWHLRKGTICELCCGGREYWCVLKNCRGSIPESIGYALRNAVARKLKLFRDNVTLFVSVTEFVKLRMVDAGFSAERIVVLPNMVSIPDSYNDASSNGKYIAYAGRISPEKGIDTLLAGARKAGLPVLLAGEYSGMPGLVKMAPANTRFIGLLNRDQIKGFYRKARFLVVPSLCFEAFGLVAAEAMSYGLPVIASRIGGLPEIVKDGVTGFLFEPGDADELAEKMSALWRNRDLCLRMGLAGRQKVIREYSEDAYYKQLIAVYRKAIEINEQLREHNAKL